MIILFFGDITGKSGRAAVKKLLPKFKKELAPDLILANVENAAHGKGITLKIAAELLDAGIEFFTSGNHIFDKPEAKDVFEKYPEKIIRPANFPDTLPGKGVKIIEAAGQPVWLGNLNGQVFMAKQFDFGEIRNPFLELEKMLAVAPGDIKIKILDFHAEATSEKRAMGFFADGKLTAVIGTHTHVQTADAQVLPAGTGYITDVGMVGAKHSVIGAQTTGIVERFKAGEDSPESVPILIDEGDEYEIGYCILEIDEATGKCENIFSKLQYM